jgi:hypothetical protein
MKYSIFDMLFSSFSWYRKKKKVLWVKTSHDWIYFTPLEIVYYSKYSNTFYENMKKEYECEDYL